MTHAARISDPCQSAECMIDQKSCCLLAAACCQVPYRLGQVAVMADDPLSPKGFAALSALSVLIFKASSEDALPTGPPGHALTGSALLKSLTQQLKQTGLLAALPGFLDIAATTLAAVQQEPVLADVPYDAHQIRDGSARLPEPPAAADIVRHVLRMQDLFPWLLKLASYVLACCPRELDMAAAGLATLGLCRAVLQHCSRRADLIPPDAATPPTALEQFMSMAWAAGLATCSAWQWHTESLDPVVLQSTDAMRTICMLLLVPTICPEYCQQEPPQLPNSLSGILQVVRRNNQRLLSDSSKKASLAAWQFACTHAPQLPELQQQALQMLGCSGRACMYLAGHNLKLTMQPESVGILANAYLKMAQGTGLLDQRMGKAEQRRLAEALSEFEEGDPPPSSSPMTPCAPLLWLMPTILLQWVSKQPQDRPQFAVLHNLCATALWPSMEQIVQQQRFWVQTEQDLFEAAGGDEANREEQQAMLDSLRAMFLGGAAMAPILPAGTQNLTPEQRRKRKMFKAASKVAADFVKAWSPPTSCLAELLLLAGSAGDALVARMQNDSSSSRQDGPGSSSLLSAAAGTACEPEDLQEGLLRLSNAVPPLLQLSSASLYYLTHKAARAARHDVLSNMQAYGIYTQEDIDAGRYRNPDAKGSLGSEEKVSVAALCAGLQQALPQLASLQEAAIRLSVDKEVSHLVWLAGNGGNFLYWLMCPGTFVAGNVQPGSPTVKPFASLAFTLLKAVIVIQSSPDAGEAERAAAVGCLQQVLAFSSLILRAACATTREASRGTASSSDTVITALVNSKVTSSETGSWSAEELTAIRSSTGSSSSSLRRSSSSDAVAMVSWLVALGRACSGYGLAVRQVSVPTAGEQGSQQRVMENMGKLVLEICSVLPGWLQSTVSAQLSAAGYDATGNVLELLRSAALAHRNAAQAGQTVRSQLLQGLGGALSALPFSAACNNPLCTVLTGASEQLLVVGGSRRCSGCQVARYCSKACQKVHWKQHKPACKAMATAAAAKSAAEPPA